MLLDEALRPGISSVETFAWRGSLHNNIDMALYFLGIIVSWQEWELVCIFQFFPSILSFTNLPDFVMTISVPKEWNWSHKWHPSSATLASLAIFTYIYFIIIIYYYIYYIIFNIFNNIWSQKGQPSSATLASYTIFD